MAGISICYPAKRDFLDRPQQHHSGIAHLRLCPPSSFGVPHVSRSSLLGLRRFVIVGYYARPPVFSRWTDVLWIHHISWNEQSLTAPRSIYTVQQVCIPQAILGTDVLCQAKSGLGKTAVFVLTTLQQVEPVPGESSVLVMCHTRELAYQIKNEYARFSKYMPEVKTAVFYGGTPMQKDIEVLANKDTHPHIIVATPGRLNALVRDKKLRLGNIKVFVLDECDKMLDQIGKPQPCPGAYGITHSQFSRYASRCSGDLPRHPYTETSHDVQRYAVSGD